MRQQSVLKTFISLRVIGCRLEPVRIFYFMIYQIEIWKDIAGFENYQISTLGEIRNTNSGLILKQSIKNSGYFKISLFKNNVSKTFMTHRLVCLTFIQNPDNKPQVNHKDTDKRNNCLYNLEWCTQGENLIHSYANNTRVTPMQKLVLNISTGIFYESIAKAAFSINMKDFNLEHRFKGDTKNQTDFILI